MKTRLKLILYNKRIYLIKILLILLTISCNGGGSTEAPPAFIQFIQAPEENAVLSQNRVIFVWRSSDNNFMFRYRLLELNEENLSNYIDWSNFSTGTEIEFTELNEGKYQFQLEAKSKNYTATLTRKFSIDAIKGPILTFNKLSTSSLIGALDSVSVWMEDIQDLAAFKLSIDFNPNILTFEGVGVGQAAINSNFYQLIVPNVNTVEMKNEINRTGRLIINSAFLKSDASLSDALSGSGRILSIKFTGKNKGTTKLEFTNIELKKLDGSNIFYKTPVSGTYTIK